MTYYIYHIEGVKIGCTVEPNERVKVQGYNAYLILEEHDDIYIASDREQELQKEYGYQIDKIPYWQSIINFDKAKQNINYYKLGKQLTNWQKETNYFESDSFSEGASKGGITQGKHNVESGHMNRMRAAGNFNKKSIIGYNRFTNELIGEWGSLTECANELRLRVPKISECINGKRKYHKDYTFNYKPL